MNEFFHEPTKHDCLQDVIHMFTMHVHPMSTQRTFQHFEKIDPWTSREITNSHIIFWVIQNNIVNSSIPRWGDINMGEIVHWVSKMLTSQLLVCCCVILKTKRSFHFYATTNCGLTICIDQSHNDVSIHRSHM
jgi:hypothetical protein